MTYTITTTVDGQFEDVLEATAGAIEDEGFGLLTEIDVQSTLEQKLDTEFRRYRMLGACNPSLARDGLDTEPELGALLPCNVVVYETESGAVSVHAVDPERLIGVTGNSELAVTAADVGERFERVIAAVDERFATATDEDSAVAQPT